MCPVPYQPLLSVDTTVSVLLVLGIPGRLGEKVGLEAAKQQSARFHIPELFMLDSRFSEL